MRYLIYDGGNALQLPWSTQTSGRVGDYQVLYAEHHKRRTLEIEKHIDTQSYAWNGFSAGISGESDDKPIDLASGDELATHIFGRGALMDYIVFHVKREGSGTIMPFIEQDDGTRIDVIGLDGNPLTVDLAVVGHTYGMVPFPESDTPAPALLADDDEDAGGTTSVDVVIPEQTVTATVPAQTATASVAAASVDVDVPAQTVSVSLAVTDADGNPAGTADGDVEVATQAITVDVPAQDVDVPVAEQDVDVVIPSQTVTIQVPRGASAAGGGAGKPAPYITTDNGIVGFTFTAEQDDDGADMAFDTCVGIYMSVKDFWDEHECSCAPAPCDTEYPPAICAPNKKPSGSSGS